MRRKVAMFLALACVGFAPAESRASTAIHADLEAAHQFWQTGAAVPEPADASGPCRGRWNVIPKDDYADPLVQGTASGLGFIFSPTGGVWTDERGNRWDWFVQRCEFTMRSTIEGGFRRCVVTHEVGHFIYGPGHEGLMSYDAMNKCVTTSHDLEIQAAVDAELATERREARRQCRRDYRRGKARRRCLRNVA